MSSLVYISYFSGHHIQISDQITPRRKGWIWLTVSEGLVLHGREGIMEQPLGSGDRKLVHIVTPDLEAKN